MTALVTPMSAVDAFELTKEDVRYGGICVVEVDGASWRASTDGKLMVATLEEPRGGEAPPDGRLLSGFLSNLSRPSAPPHRVSVKKLREWVGAPLFLLHGVDCDECGGTGMVYHFCNCERCQDHDSDVPCGSCEGQGQVDRAPDLVCVTIEGVRLERNLLSHAAILLAEDACDAWFVPIRGGNALRLFGANTRIAVTGMVEDSRYAPVSRITLAELTLAPV